MKRTYPLLLLLALGAPAAAELAAPQLPLIDAASVRADLADSSVTAVPVPDKSRAAGPQVRAEGRLFSYNKATRQFDIPAGRGCAVTLRNFRSYTDTEHGTPSDVVSADYALEGFADFGNYVSGNAVGGAPDKYTPYVTLQNYLQSGLTKGVDVKIFVDNVPSVQALLAGSVPPVSVYVTKENSMTSYFGGDGTKWGYWCDLRRP